MLVNSARVLPAISIHIVNGHRETGLAWLCIPGRENAATNQHEGISRKKEAGAGGRTEFGLTPAISHPRLRVTA